MHTRRTYLPACCLALLLAGCTGTDQFSSTTADTGDDADVGLDSGADTTPDALLDGDALDASLDADDGAPDAVSDAPFDGAPDLFDATDAALDASDLDDVALDSNAAPARYRDEQLRSPITAYVAERLRALATVGTERAPDVFMKVGASGTVSRSLLYCFAGEAQPGYTLDLAGRTALLPTIEFFRGGDAEGDTPFDRPSEAALSGRSAVWAITGSPSPLETEIAALNPRYAFINYGTNDMGQGTTPQSALWPFVQNLGELLDQTIEAGIIPIVTGLNPRDDSATYARWVTTYNTVTRGLAEARQVPYINLYLATVGLPGMGLLSDGIHGNTYRVDGSSQPCVFTAPALEYNYNVRNLLSLQALHQVREVAFGTTPPEAGDDVHAGSGSAGDPFAIDALPFTHSADTAASASDAIDAYPSCDSGQNESGPEYSYRFSLAAETAVRLVVFVDAGVDVDLHLLDGPTGSDCLARHDRVVQGTFAAGTYTVVVDSFVPSDGVPRDGPYLFAILECEPGDPACD